MELFNKFFNNLFYPFLIGIAITIIFVVIMVNINTFNAIDLKTSKNIISIEKKHSKININTISIILINDLIKVQLGLEQQILFYNEFASKFNNSYFSTQNIQDYLYNYYELKKMNLTEINVNRNETDSMRNITDFYSVWFVDQYTTSKNLTKNTTLYTQLLIYSSLIQSIYSFRTSISEIVTGLHFYFESTNLYISFPYKETRILNDSRNPPWCTDENGNLITVFNFKCFFPYELIKLSEDSIFDANNKDQPYRKIFIFNTKRNISSYLDNNYIMCIKFKDKLTNNNAYICADLSNNKLFKTFEDFNTQLKGTFIITSVGFQSMFFYPFIFQRNYQSFSELIYTWSKTFYLSEKTDFIKNIQRRFTSNYIKYINLESIKKNQMVLFNSVEQPDGNNYFYLKGEKLYYDIFPILLENYDKEYEHVLSVIHLYNKTLYYENMKSYYNYTQFL